MTVNFIYCFLGPQCLDAWLNILQVCVRELDLSHYALSEALHTVAGFYPICWRPI